MMNFTAMMNNFSIEMKGLGERVHHVENKMEDYTSTLNDLVDAYKHQTEDAACMRAKIADLEDRSRKIMLNCAECLNPLLQQNYINLRKIS